MNLDFFITKLGIVTDFLIIFIVMTLIRTKSRGFFWKAKDGSELSMREFFKRWGKGIEGITPLQQSRTQLLGIWITITGIVSGIIINALVRLENVWWWLEIILIGSLILTGVQFISIYQVYKIRKKVEQTMKELEKGEPDENP